MRSAISRHIVVAESLCSSSSAEHGRALDRYAVLAVATCTYHVRIHSNDELHCGM